MHNMILVILTLVGLVAASCARLSAGSHATEYEPIGINRIEFNQTVLRSVASAGLTPSRAVEEPRVQATYSDPRSVLRFVLSSAPAEPVVYPTERYFYYYFPLGPRLVSGNIRFADAEQGGISIGYFDTHNQSDMQTREFHDGQDGVRIEFRAGRHEVVIAVDGVERTFVLDQEAFENPAFPLLDGEELVSGVRDESGYFFHLVYWRPGRAFYYVLNPTKPLPEAWSHGESTKVELWWGDRSRFCFLHEPRTGRFILVGVHQREIRENGWYDGPFDQVPPNLPIRAMLEEAYPYVKDAGGLDEHGNFLNVKGQRVAISPYQEYDSGPQLEASLERMVRDVETPAAWAAATYEYKRDWRPPARPTDGGHVQSLSASWPANHWGASSGAWGPQHQEAVSASWPPNHAFNSSQAAH